MKALYKLTLTACLALLLSSAAWQAAAQCGNDNSQFGTSTITCGAASTVLTTCIYGGEYRLVNVTLGNTYTFSTCGDTDFDTQITLFNDTGGAYLAYNDDGCGAQSTVTWTATFTGAVRVLVDQYNCISNTTCMTLNASCTVQGSGSGCTTASYGLYPSSTYTPVCNGIAGTITGLGYAGEYSNVSVTSGTAYTFSSSISGDYITIAGSTGSPVYTTGTGSATWTSTVTGTVRFYTHTNSSCGESASSRTRAVVCGSAPTYDPCASITTLTCGQSTTASSTGSGAWNVAACGFSTPGQEKVYSFTPTISGIHTLVLTSTNSLYSDYFYKVASGGCNASGWTCIDDLSTTGFITFGPLTAGTAYYILYDPESTSTVTHTFRIDCPVPPCNSPGTPSASNVSTTSATLSWAAASGATSYDWSVGTGVSCPNGSTTNTAATSVNLSNLTPNTTYTFCVRTSACGGGGATSYVSTTFTTAPLANDACAGAIPVTCGSTINGSTVGAASDAGLGFCAGFGVGGGEPGNGIWYKLVGNGAQVTANLCGSAYDTKLHVYTGTCGSLTCLVSNDDSFACTALTRSQVVFNASVGTDYYILVSGFGSATGAFSLNLTCLCGPVLGAPWTTTNIGASNGGAIENVCDGTIDVKATNYGSPTNDVQTYAWQQMCGNGFIKAKLNNVTNGGWGGLMFRENNAGGSKKIAIRSQLTNAVIRDLRATTNGVMQQQMFPKPNAPQWLRLTRTGNVFLGETSVDGVNWDFTFSTTLVLPNCIEVGLFAQSINVNTTSTAVFSNIMGVSTSPPVIPLADGSNGDVAVQEVLSLFPNPATDEINVKNGSFLRQKRNDFCTEPTGPGHDPARN
ncbi:MAG: fibronectin type III domain-containing protein [Saprospiraceae bacterium]|nr:fibronectin type III domain-containing protein [Saprospiraceae bacterium]